MNELELDELRVGVDRDLDYWLETITVEYDLDPEFTPSELIEAGWVGVCNQYGIIAYFGNDVDAFRFRLNEINRMLNS